MGSAGASSPRYHDRPPRSVGDRGRPRSGRTLIEIGARERSMSMARKGVEGACSVCWVIAHAPTESLPVHRGLCAGGTRPVRAAPVRPQRQRLLLLPGCPALGLLRALRFRRSASSCQIGTQSTHRIDCDEDGAVKDEERKCEEVLVILMSALVVRP